MRAWASFWMSLIMSGSGANASGQYSESLESSRRGPVSVRDAWPGSAPALDQRADVFTAQHALQHTRLAHVEDPQGQVAVAAQRKCSGVHHLQVAGDHLVVIEPLEADRVAMFLRILVVHAIDLGRLEQQVGADLDRPQCSAGIGGEKRIARSGGEDDDATLLEVADRASTDVVLADVVDLDRAHYPRPTAELLQRILHRQRVDD